LAGAVFRHAVHDDHLELDGPNVLSEDRVKARPYVFGLVAARQDDGHVWRHAAPFSPSARAGVSGVRCLASVGTVTGSRWSAKRRSHTSSAKRLKICRYQTPLLRSPRSA